MSSLLERRIDSVDQRLVLLAPPRTAVPSSFCNVTVDPARRERHLREMQRMRGAIYVEDGAVHPDQLSDEGLHETSEDDQSWHLLIYKEKRRLVSCVWYLEHENTVSPDQLRVRDSPLWNDPIWREPLARAVDGELVRAQRARLRYAEIGGWAVEKESRCTWEGLLLALAVYSLGRSLGGALGMTTATVRHSSSTILKRIGGSPLGADELPLPPYYDPKYSCEMELLRFDSRRPDPRFALIVELLRHKLSRAAVVAPDAVCVAATTSTTDARAPQPVPLLVPAR